MVPLDFIPNPVTVFFFAGVPPPNQAPYTDDSTFGPALVFLPFQPFSFRLIIYPTAASLQEPLLPPHLHSLGSLAFGVDTSPRSFPESFLPFFLTHIHSFSLSPTHRNTLYQRPHSHHTCLTFRGGKNNKDQTRYKHQETPHTS